MISESGTGFQAVKFIGKMPMPQSWLKNPTRRVGDRRLDLFPVEKRADPRNVPAHFREIRKHVATSQFKRCEHHCRQA